MLAELSRAHEQEADEVSRVAAFAASLQTENETLRHLLVKVTDEDGAVTDPIPIDTSTAARWLPKRRARGGPPAVPEVDRAWAAAQSAMGTRIVSPPSAVRKLSLARTLSPTQAGPGSPLGARGLLSPVRLPPPTYSVPSARTGLEVRPLAVSPSASVGLSGSGDGALPLVPPPKLLATSLVRRSLSTGSEPLDIDIPLSPVLAPGSEYDRPAEGVTSPANARRGEGSARTDTAPA
ncbi:hypothetical protein EON62_04785 [archaeon]|nr:MAG: hypothetical protein EON62_04785 [archaeon]